MTRIMSLKKFPKRKSDDNRPAKAAVRRKITDLLARRSLSKVEIRRKLAVHEYTSDEIEDAIEFAERNNWLSSSEDLAEQVTQTLNRKKKSARFITHFLEEKGLPAPPGDPKAELKKALSIVQSKLAKEKGFDLEEKQKIQRLLTNRGFDSSTIRKVIERK